MSEDYSRRVAVELAELRKRSLALRSGDGLDSGKKAALFDEACTELDVALEELSVASEELQVQGETLDSAAEQLRVSGNRFDNLLLQSPIGCLFTDMSGRILEANDSACRLLNVPRPELLQRPFDLFMIPGRRAEFRRRLDVIRASPEPSRQPAQIQPRNRASREIDLIAAGSRDAWGTTGFIRWLFWDVGDTGASSSDRFLSRASVVLGRKQPKDALPMVLVELGRRFSTRATRIVFRTLPDGRVAVFPSPAVSGPDEPIAAVMTAAFPSPGETDQPAPCYGAVATDAWLPLYVENTHEEQFAGDGARAAAGWLSSLVVPLLARDDLQAVLVLASSRRGGFSPPQRALASLVGPMLSGVFASLASELRAQDTGRTKGQRAGRAR